MSESPTHPDAPRAGGETPEMLATNYALAFDLLKVAGWIAAHTLRGETADEQFAILYRAVSHLRGESREPVQRLDELLRNDPWAAAIASHVQASLLERHRDGERLDWLEHCNSQKRGGVPILPPSCGYSVRQYIDAQLADANTPCAAGPSPERASK